MKKFDAGGGPHEDLENLPTQIRRCKSLTFARRERYTEGLSFPRRHIILFVFNAKDMSLDVISFVYKCRFNYQN